ncbi:MAG: UDP-N-acetylmuramoyl-tripeptide--D-alanyl-D-alanine ligase [Desulfatirhabdiaceae bacterium]
MNWTIDHILDATEGGLLAPLSNVSFSGISIDSRTIQPTDVFVAITGSRHDGHRFIDRAIDAGVKGVVLEHRKIPEIPVEQWIAKGIVCIAVTDSVCALGRLAAFHRKRMPASVIAITGSNGKTSTRNLTHDVMRQQFRVLATSGNFNNHIGLPLTLFKLTPDHEWAVLELGMNHAGEIDWLARVCQPQIGIITNIAPAHIEGLHSLDGIMAAKGELLKHLPADGVAVMNMDDPRVSRLSREAPCPVIGFGFDSAARIRATDVVLQNSGTRFQLHFPDSQISVHLHIPGRVMIQNALAAAAAGYAAGIPPILIQKGLEGARAVSGRMNLFQTRQGVTIIDDTYNANPGSTEAAIRTLNAIGAGYRRFLVLGDMLELGDQAAFYHQQIGRLAGESGLYRLYITGDFADVVAGAACEAGMAREDIMVGSKPEIARELNRVLGPEDHVLVKGSRGMAMETVVQSLSGKTESETWNAHLPNL